MLRRKRIREKGKLSLSRVYQELKEGDRVVLMHDLAFKASFPSRLQGKTALIKGKRGKAFVVELRDGKKIKRFIIRPIHLRKLKS